MDWRRPTMGEAWEIALVVLVLLAGGAMLAGLPRSAADRSHHSDWACAWAVADDAACTRRAEAPVIEGRAVRKDAR